MPGRLRSVGRGGAGNFTPQNGNDEAARPANVGSPTLAPCYIAKPSAPPAKVCEENMGAYKYMLKAQAQDPEAKKPPTVVSVPAQPQPYARVGRGGAGNLYDPTAVPPGPGEQAAPDRTGTAVAAQSGARAGLTGRGGLGNFSGTTTPATQQQNSEMRKEETLADKVVRNVDAELSVPPKIYTSPRKGGA